MTFRQEIASWATPTALLTASPPAINEPAPSCAKLPFPPTSKEPTIITFLRHCGCPFAEKTFKKLTTLSTVHPSITFVAVSHSSASATEKWVTAVGGVQNLEVIVDEERELYAQWGLGTSGVWHVLNPWSLWSVYRLGKQEGIWNRPTESGNRWQTSGSWAVNTDGLVRWGGVANSADEIPDFNEALEALKIQD